MRVWRRNKTRTVMVWSRVQAVLYVGLSVVLWLAGCGLAALGTLAAAFFVLTGASLHTFLLHFNNLTARYVAASAARQMAFAELASAAVVVLLAGVCVVRLPVLVQRLRLGLGREGGDAA